jgi:hypothetical protein
MRRQSVEAQRLLRREPGLLLVSGKGVRPSESGVGGASIRVTLDRGAIGLDGPLGKRLLVS